MGCFLACFGSSKDRRRREQSIRRAQPRVQRCPSLKPVHVPLQQVSAETAVDPVPEFQRKDEAVEQLSLNIRKKVTFDSNVKTYELASQEEVTDCALDPINGVNNEGNPENSSKSASLSLKSTRTQSSSEDVTSMGSFPWSHRYQNCRESDDEGEDMELGMSDIDDEDCLYGDDDDDGGLVHLRSKISADQVITEEVDYTEMLCEEKEKAKPIGCSNPSARDRSAYVHPVLNPVENLSQWRAVKARVKPQKENFELKELPFSCRAKCKQANSSGPSVDASLSNWLVSAEATSGSDACTPLGRNKSPGSNSVTSHEDRPILGALTMEEIRQFSGPSSSPRKSPCRSPDDMAIIGSVGSYWSSSECSSAAVSYKGIPNTTSKYSEDRKVNWHSTPFETRLERALERGAAAKALC